MFKCVIACALKRLTDHGDGSCRRCQLSTGSDASAQMHVPPVGDPGPANISQHQQIAGRRLKRRTLLKALARK